MKIKHYKNRVDVSFQPEDPYFQLGNILIAQAQLLSPYQTKTKNPLDMNGISLEIKDLFSLEEALPTLSTDEITDLLYILVHMTRQIEESGFMKRTSIWCNFSELYYDPIKKRPVVIMLPVCGEVTFADGLDWNTRCLASLEKILAYYPKELRTKIYHRIQEFLETDRGFDRTLDLINQQGNGQSSTLVPNIENKEIPTLELRYIGKEGTLTLQTRQEEYLIGKNSSVVDGVVFVEGGVSRVHCKAIRQGRQYFIQDLDSLNHTFVNGEVIPPFEMMEINDQDILALGAVEFRVHLL